MPDVINILQLPHGEAKKLARSGAPIYLPINPVEYHGPHLSLRNDGLVSSGLIRQLGDRLQKKHDWPILVAPDLEIGVEPSPGVGSRWTHLPTARTIIREACRALAELGATKVVLVTFHGAPLHALGLESGVSLLREHGVKALSPFNALLRELLNEGMGLHHEKAFAHVTDASERTDMQENLHRDFHAGFFETSMTLHFAPDSVDPNYKNLPPCPTVTPNANWARASRAMKRAGRDGFALELDLISYAMGWHALKPFPGYTGRPHRATAETGAYFAKEMIDIYENLVERVLLGDEKSPPPILSWTGAFTLSGRIVPVRQSSKFAEHIQ